MEIKCPDPTPDTFIFYAKQGHPLSNQFLNKVLAKALKRVGITKKISMNDLQLTGISYFERHKLD